MCKKDILVSFILVIQISTLILLLYILVNLPSLLTRDNVVYVYIYELEFVLALLAVVLLEFLYLYIFNNYWEEKGKWKSYNEMLTMAHIGTCMGYIVLVIYMPVF